MPSKKKKYNARFPPGRIKKIMQTDEEVGKVAQAVPIIIYILFKRLTKRQFLLELTLELFVESLLTKTVRITNARHAKTLSPSHMKQCIMSESRFDFLRELVKNVPDISVSEEIDNSSSPQSGEQGGMLPEEGTNGTSSSGRNGRSVKGESWLRSYGRPASMDFSHTGFTQDGNKCLTPNVIHLDSSEGNNSVIKYTATARGAWGQKAGARESQGSSSLRPPKLGRYDSAPGCFSAPPTSSDTPMFSFDLRQKLGDFPPTHLPNPLATSTITSTTNVTRESVAGAPPQPPVLKIDTCNTPVVKIDYSHLPLNMAAPPAAVTPAPQQTLPSAAPSTASELDEDYDNI
ncbi:uncharacterized protein DMENIID0001_115130 [Sergentomyia squamirostris]